MVYFWQEQIFCKFMRISYSLYNYSYKGGNIMEKNIAQDQVIQTIKGQLIVVACPGSGKTTTMLRRIRYMIEEKHISPKHILMLTFSNAAAREMRTRYEAKYEKDDVTFCTIHSMCMAILRKFCGMNNSAIYSDGINFFYEALRKNNTINDKEEFIKNLINDISIVKTNFFNVNDYKPKCCNDKELFMSLFEQYEAHKEELGLIDFDDMMIQALNLMRSDNTCLSWLQQKYQYIQVDEYQDTNYLQRDIIYMLAGDNGNIAVVGDDDQSIYGFRGARPDVMMDFSKKYENALRINMVTNYRSNSEIIKNADKLIQNNTSRFKKKFLGFHKETGKVEHVTVKDRTEEVCNVALRIQKLIKAGVDPNNIAILYRTNQQSEAIASILSDAKIPFTSNEKIPSCYQHWMLEDIKSYRRLAVGSWSKKDLARVINHPQRFLFDKGYLRVGLDMKAMQAIAKKECNNWKKNKAYDAITSFFFLIQCLKSKNPKDFLKSLSWAGHYERYLEEYAEFRNDDSSNLEWIWNKYNKDAEKYDDWTEWGHYILKYNKALEKASKQKNGVVLSTMHSSKGLEWDYVFIIDCIEGYCPYRKAAKKEEIEEERRLFYVAVTRAKKELYLYSFKKKGSNKEVRVSPFVREMI